MSDYPDIFMGRLKKSRRKVSQNNRRTFSNSNRPFYKYMSTALDTPLPPRKAGFNRKVVKRAEGWSEIAKRYYCEAKSYTDPLL